MAAAELGWLDGSLADLHPSGAQTLRRVGDAGFAVVAAELTAYLRRVGVPVVGPSDPPGPWASTLRDPASDAATAWRHVGERYECAVAKAPSSDSDLVAEGLATLTELRAVATIPAVG